ncbi:MAG TPA: P-loop NTPase fold protein, partial [Thiobacillaceae bacterium]|nr:P-loop NTPase fold protein [Thiobacillaceae bacterium]
LHALASGPEAGRRAWAVGTKGTILTTADGGATWTPQASGTKEPLLSLHALASGPEAGRRAWAVGGKGTILTTADGGATWTPQASGTKETLVSVHALASGPEAGRRAWAVGDNGTILTTADGGAHWQPVRYRKLLAPWFWPAAGLVLAGLAWSLWIWRRPEALDWASGVGVTDDPIQSRAQDRLAFAPVARGVARFLRNVGTRPPLVLAITAPWGQGKSSLMALLRAELDTAGARSVWFNAWHHQQSSDARAALLATVAETGLPHSLSLRGLAFRGRLLWRRAGQHPGLAGVTGVLLGGSLFALGAWVTGQWAAWTAAMADAASGDGGGAWLKGANGGVAAFWTSVLDLALGRSGGMGEDGGLVDAINALGQGKVLEALGKLGTDPHLLGLAAWLLAGGMGLYLLYGSFLRAFPEQPLAAVADWAARMRLTEDTAYAGFTDRFRRHFRDVTEALAPRPLVLFVDDLDRCTPEHAMATLETVNYLVSNGPCIVVLGIARDIVEAQVAEQVGALAERYGRATADGATVANNDAARREYARNYLRKLIQIEIPVPRRDAGGIAQATLEFGTSADAPQGTPLGRWQRARKALRQGVGILLDGIGTGLRRGLYAAVFGFLLLSAGALWDAFIQRQSQDAQHRDALAERAQTAVLRAMEVQTAAERAQSLVAGKPAKLAATVPAASSPAAAEADQRCDKTAWRPARPLSAERAQVAAYIADTARTAEATAKQVAELRAESASADKLKAKLDLLDAQHLNARCALARLEAPASTGKVVSPTGPGRGDHVEQAPRTENNAPQKDPSNPEEDRIAPTPQWPAWGALGLFVLLLIGAVLTRDPYQLVDAKAFADALHTGARLLATRPDLNSPREVKRYFNLARYAAARLSDEDGRTLVPREQVPWLAMFAAAFRSHPVKEPD